MTSTRRPPTDRDLERLLRSRAADADMTLLQDIMAATEAAPQRSTWFGPRGDQRRRLVLLTAAMLATLLVGGALAMGQGPAPPEPPPPLRVHQIEQIDGSLEVGTTYWVDPDYNISTPLRVTFTVPTEGWLAWTGTYKDIHDEEVDYEDDVVPRERISINIVEVRNLTVDGCRDHSLRTPPVGPSVDDLAHALQELPPFEVISPATEVSAYGYRGKHLVLRIPEDMVATDALFEGCIGAIRSWWAPVMGPSAYYGYVRPGDTEEYWLLDVEGTRLVISVLTAAGTSQELISEKQAVLDSIVIVP